MSSHGITHLIELYGYAAVFAATGLQAGGAPLPGTTVLAAASVYAAAGHGLSIVGVIAAGAAGALAGTLAGYWLGRWGGQPLLAFVARRLRQPVERVGQLQAELAARGVPWLFVARFVTGLRNIAGLLAGASQMSLRRFLMASAVACALWSLVSGLEYYWFGRALVSADTWVQVLLVLVGVAATVLTLHLLRRRALRRSYSAAAVEAVPTRTPRSSTPTNQTRPARTP